MDPRAPVVDSQRRRRPRVRPAGLYLQVLLVFLVLYGLTAQRGPAWQDSGAFQWRTWTFELNSPLGLALAHPLLIVLGKAFQSIPVGPVAWRLNLLSAVCGAAAAANVALLVARLAPNRPAAARLAGAFFGLAHTPFWLATVCESQMLLAAVFTAELNLLLWLVRRPGAVPAGALGVAAGLGWSTHNLALLALPAYAAVLVHLAIRRPAVRGTEPVRAGRGWVLLPVAAVAWLAGASLMLALVGQEAARAGLGAAVQSALFGKSWRGAVLGGSARAVAMGAGYVLYNFPNLALPLAAAGLWGLRRSVPPAMRWALGYLGAVYLLFAIRYAVPDQFMFFVPAYAVAAALAGLGAARAMDLSRWRWVPTAAVASVVVTVAIYLLAPAAWTHLDLPLPGRKDLAFRDPGRYWLTPWKASEDSAGRFARAALSEVPAGGAVVADTTSYYPLLWVQRVEGVGPAARLLLPGEATPQTLPPGTTHVFAVSDLPAYCPRWLLEAADLRRDAGRVLFRVVWRAPATGRR